MVEGEEQNLPPQSGFKKSYSKQKRLWIKNIFNPEAATAAAATKSFLYPKLSYDYLPCLRTPIIGRFLPERFRRY